MDYKLEHKMENKMETGIIVSYIEYHRPFQVHHAALGFLEILHTRSTLSDPFDSMIRHLCSPTG